MNFGVVLLFACNMKKCINARACVCVECIVMNFGVVLLFACNKRVRVCVCAVGSPINIDCKTWARLGRQKIQQ